MKIALFDSRPYDREFFAAVNLRFGHNLVFFEARLNQETAKLAGGHDVVCSFVNDRVDRATLQQLADLRVRLLALRSAGFNHVDLLAAQELGIPVVRVPEYSPHAVAEHAVGLVLALNRKIHRSYARVREWNFALDGLVGFDLNGKTVGLVGVGRIGRVAAQIFRGFGCNVVCYDLRVDADLETRLHVRYLDLPDLYRQSDILSLHLPLTPQTHHMINDDTFALTKRGVMLINTGRGALVDSRALIAALKCGQVGAAGLDVYEEEEGIFFEDLSNCVLQDDTLARLLTFPNVIITSHQAFLTREALSMIATITLDNVSAFERGELRNEVRPEAVLGFVSATRQ